MNTKKRNYLKNFNQKTRNHEMETDEGVSKHEEV
jgi:hypothetical protein